MRAGPGWAWVELALRAKAEWPSSVLCDSELRCYSLSEKLEMDMNLELREMNELSLSDLNIYPIGNRLKNLGSGVRLLEFEFRLQCYEQISSFLQA